MHNSPQHSTWSPEVRPFLLRQRTHRRHGAKNMKIRCQVPVVRLWGES